METSTPAVITDYSIPGLAPFKSGKVREVYDVGDALLFVATDRISAFDSILPTGIPWKGHVLNQLSTWWFGRTRDIVPNHFLSSNLADYPESLRDAAATLQGRSMLVKKAEALPVECVVRGYLIGSGWKEYQHDGTVCGIPLRDDYRMADRLDTPIFTPAAKADTGHDENISFAEAEKTLGADIAAKVRDISIALYKHAAAYAREHDIIIADTKFEFGLVDGEVTLIDEVLTPDSSRFWPAGSYVPGVSPPSFDKQFVRDYLESIHWDKEPPAPSLPEDVAGKTSEKYLQAFKILTGKLPEA
jgi:phosphoribosylaminoimidazole-succinocarboxamide synthase